MMKSLIPVLLATASLVLPLGAAIPTEASPQADPAAVPSAPAQAANPVQADMALQKELYQLLKTVTDKASADSAAPRVAEIGREMYGNIDAILEYLKTDKIAARAAFVAMREDAGFREASKGWNRQLSVLRQTTPPCYGSTALREALKEVKSEPEG